MCFYSGDDYDWIATVHERTEGPADKPRRCCKCRQRIHKGEWCRRDYLQQREEAEGCDPATGYHHDDCNWDGEDPAFEGCVRDVGETSEDFTCEWCVRVRNAIIDVETAEGCDGRESEPRVGAMSEEVFDGEGWGHYTDKMIAMGLWDAVPFVSRLSRTDPNDVFEEIAYGDSPSWDRKPSGVCAGAVDYDRYGDVAEIGGEA